MAPVSSLVWNESAEMVGGEGNRQLSVAPFDVLRQIIVLQDSLANSLLKRSSSSVLDWLDRDSRAAAEGGQVSPWKVVKVKD